MISLGDIAQEVHLRVEQEDSDSPALTRSGVHEMTKAVFDIISQAIVAGEEVSIPKFGKFATVVRDARKGRNPHTGKAIEIPARMGLKFKASSVLKIAVGEMDVTISEAPPKKKAKKKAKGKGKKKK